MRKWERTGPLAVLACSTFTRHDRISEVVFHEHFCLVGVCLLGVILLMLSTERFLIHILSWCSGGRGDLYIVVRTAHYQNTQVLLLLTTWQEITFAGIWSMQPSFGLFVSSLVVEFRPCTSGSCAPTPPSTLSSLSEKQDAPESR